MKKNFFLLVFICLSLMLQAQQWQWATKASSTSATEIPHQITVDKTGSVYVLANNNGSATYNFYTTAAGPVLIKYNNLGAIQWARNLNFSPSHIGTDQNLNIYLSTSYQNTINAAMTTFTSKGSNDILLVKLDNVGTELWARSYGGPSNDALFDMAVDKNGNSYLTGMYASDTLEFSNYYLIDTSSFAPYFLSRTNSAGITNWVDRGIQDSVAYNYWMGSEIELDKYDHPNVLGQGSTCSAMNCSYFFLAKYDSTGNRFYHKWAWPGGMYTYYDNLQVDDSLNIYLVSAGGGNHPDQGSLLKFDSLITFKWNFYLGPQYGCWGFWYPRVAPNGACFLTGFAGGDVCALPPNGTVFLHNDTIPYMGEGDFLVGNLNQGGKVSWFKTAGGGGLEYGWYPFVDKQGVYHVVGQYNIWQANTTNSFSTVFDNYTLPNDGNWQQMFVAKLGAAPSQVGLFEQKNGRQNVIEIFPNPTAGQITLSSQDPLESIVIWDALGSISLDRRTMENKITLDLSELPSGIYFVQTGAGQNKKVNKIILR